MGVLDATTIILPLTTKAAITVFGHGSNKCDSLLGNNKKSEAGQRVSGRAR